MHQREEINAIVSNAELVCNRAAFVFENLSNYMLLVGVLEHARTYYRGKNWQQNEQTGSAKTNRASLCAHQLNLEGENFKQSERTVPLFTVRSC